MLSTKNLKVGTKLLLGFMIIAVIAGTIGIVGLINLNTVGAAADIIMDKELPLSDAAMESMIALVSGRDLLGEFLLTDDLEELDVIKEEFLATVNDFDNYVNYIKENASGDILTFIEEADNYHASFTDDANELMKHHRDHVAYLSEVKAIMIDFDNDADSLHKKLEDYELLLSQTETISAYMDASMEAKNVMLEQKGFVEEYKGLESLDNTQDLREDFEALNNEFAEFSDYISTDLVNKHKEFSIHAVELFDAVDKSIESNMETSVHMALVDEYGEKGDLAMDLVEEQANKSMDFAMTGADNAQSMAFIIMAAMTVAGIILALILGLLIARSITLPLKKTVDLIALLAEGDLTVKFNDDRKDEIGQLLSSMQKMSNNLSNIITEIKSSTSNVSSGSQELSSSAQEMSQGATEQASSTEEVSSAMEQMASNIRQNADNAMQTEKIASNAAKDAGESGNAVSSAVNAMKEIATRISIIEEIARQTNLLALNAAIEAARAGEHGKGFAVVASEVRKLAERSQKAAGEIGELSTTSVDIAEKAGNMLLKLVPDIDKTAELVQEISAASREQNNGVDQINRAILQLDQVVQQNASASEEVASTSEELSGQAEQLEATISFFKTNGHDRNFVRALNSPVRQEHNKIKIGHIKHNKNTEKNSTAVKELEEKPEQTVKTNQQNLKDKLDNDFEEF